MRSLLCHRPGKGADRPGTGHADAERGRQSSSPETTGGQLTATTFAPPNDVFRWGLFLSVGKFCLVRSPHPPYVSHCHGGFVRQLSDQPCDERLNQFTTSPGDPLPRIDGQLLPYLSNRPLLPVTVADLSGCMETPRPTNQEQPNAIPR